ncbi:MAG: superoxide dismutase [Candidatus Nanohaloarchaea archaeon]|nr:superoxide dismutase [Candidatus Nanohaloarchaea archaeon]
MSDKQSLIDLPYSYDALEPFISKQVMKWHHDVHHQGYVDGWNQAEEDLEEQRNKGDFSNTGSILRSFTHNYCGTVLHEIFWNNMSPDGGGKPSGNLLDKIKEDFGSFESWKKEFKSAAVANPGWALLVYIPRTDQLHNVTVDRHNDGAVWGAHPILALDVWEHSYYHDYGPDRSDFVQGFMDHINWNYVQKRFKEIRGTFQ